MDYYSVCFPDRKHPRGIGSTSFIGLALGGLFLVVMRVIPWQIPLGFLGGMFVFA
jgi:Na+-translocating ferredoxin:NAD+ oxidoreductase RnfD subunit